MQIADIFRINCGDGQPPHEFTAGELVVVDEQFAVVQPDGTLLTRTGVLNPRRFARVTATLRGAHKVRGQLATLRERFKQVAALLGQW